MGKGEEEGDPEGREGRSLGETIAPFLEACLARVQSGCHPPLINPSSASLAATVFLWAKPSLYLLLPPSQQPPTLLGRREQVVRDTGEERAEISSFHSLKLFLSLGVGGTFPLGLSF